MSLESVTGDFGSSVGNSLDILIAEARAAFQNIFGGLGTKLSNFWDGGFAGIDESNLPALKDAINKYCANIEGIISGFNEQAKVEVAYKGAVQVAATDFIGAIKQILQAYVSTIRRNISEADLAFQNYSAGAQQIAQNVSSDATQVRSDASKIRLDN